MQLSISEQTERLIAERMKSGEYATLEDVVMAGLLALEGEHALGEFEPGEMDGLLAEGEASGEPLDGEGVLEELRQLRSRHQSKAG